DKGKFHGDEGDRAVLHEPGLDAARRNHALDGRGLRRNGPGKKGGERGEADQAERSIQERFSSRAAPAFVASTSLMRYPVTERLLSNHCRAASCTSLAVTARI